jgi:hypothetical protein
LYRASRDVGSRYREGVDIVRWSGMIEMGVPGRLRHIKTG